MIISNAMSWSSATPSMQVSRWDEADCSNLQNNANIKVTFDQPDADIPIKKINKDLFRIFKLARHITGLQTLGMTLKNRWPINSFIDFANNISTSKGSECAPVDYRVFSLILLSGGTFLCHININQHESTSIRINRHQSELIIINQHQ